MANEGHGVVAIHWYSTVFRADSFEEALTEIAPVAVRYGATDFRVYRARDDIYKFIQMASFDTKVEWERYWYGPEFSEWRGHYTSWYQVPVVPQWNDLVLSGGVEGERARIDRDAEQPSPQDGPEASEVAQVGRSPLVG
ncbi:MAG: hypothetical protein M3P40_02200 [Actinomycetota bacterium]|nr:hypothetical protein [Actinomycetota bacterium]